MSSMSGLNFPYPSPPERLPEELSASTTTIGGKRISPITSAISGIVNKIIRAISGVFEFIKNLFIHHKQAQNHPPTLFIAYSEDEEEMTPTQAADLLRNNTEIYKKNRDVVVKAVQHNGLLLQFAHQTLKNDKDVCFAALRQTPLAIKHVGLLDLQDALVAKEIVESHPNGTEIFNKHATRWIKGAHR